MEVVGHVHRVCSASLAEGAPCVGECVCRPLLVVVDMPGYGFAFANDEKQEAWHKLVSEHGYRRRGREWVGDWKARRGVV